MDVASYRKSLIKCVGRLRQTYDYTPTFTCNLMTGIHSRWGWFSLHDWSWSPKRLGWITWTTSLRWSQSDSLIKVLTLEVMYFEEDDSIIVGSDPLICICSLCHTLPGHNILQPYHCVTARLEDLWRHEKPCWTEVWPGNDWATVA